MNAIVLTDRELVILPRGWGRLWGFRWSVRVPLAHVRGATADPGAADEPRGFRAPGLGLPRRAVGTFHRNGESTYWNVGPGAATLVVRFRDERLAGAVLTVEDPRGEERRITAALARSGSN